jgi:hypothetical protein
VQRADGGPVTILERDDDPELTEGSQRPGQACHQALVAGQDGPEERAPGQRDRDLVGTTVERAREGDRVASEEQRVRQAAAPRGTCGADRRLAQAGRIGIDADTERRRRSPGGVQDRGAVTGAEVDRQSRMLRDEPFELADVDVEEAPAVDLSHGRGW